MQEIARPADAIHFLNEWPEDRRDRIHEAALRACSYNGRKPASAARKSFFRFAKQVVILEDATSAMQWLAACMSDSGKAQV
ncbi:DUF982 domain-containing protein [Mesorhizobium sp. M0400]|uniref:DUF982 domain-containing protein n=1 Tax=Mesorhizobium sp. M0400 TaxID=2956941 RepID=UPI00333D8BBE